MGETDTISRQMAIDTIMGQPPEPHYPSWYAAQIEKLPAAQPDHTADVSKKVEGDCISRQAAIDLFPNDSLEWDTKGGYIAPHLARRMIEELPFAQPKTCEGCKHLGKWEFEVEYGYSSPCTLCKRRVVDYYER